jgi:UDP-N-acetylmuramyl pentapeptide phosphotransferase/UDP-N-acetylglucosamine-1-phosphate transferase
MIQALRLLFGLLVGHVGMVREHAQARATHVALLAVFGGIAFVFVLILATVGLARWLGAVEAIAVMAGFWALACIGVLIAMRSEQRRHEQAKERRKSEEKRVAMTAALSALPLIRSKGGLLTMGLGALGLTLLLGRGRKRGGEDA